MRKMCHTVLSQGHITREGLHLVGAVGRRFVTQNGEEWVGTPQEWDREWGGMGRGVDCNGSCPISVHKRASKPIEMCP
jgi:hypothetical protein